MSEKKARKDFEKSAGKAKALRKAGKYVIEIDNRKLELDTVEDLMYLNAAIQQLMDEEWKELQEERRAKGEVTYREIRGGKVVQEY
jgi:hypothetical protein